MKNIQTMNDNANKTSSARGLGPTFILALGTFAVGTDAFIVSAFLPDMAASLSVTPSMAGHSVTAFALAYALLAPVIATITSTIARRRLLVVALALLGLANIASALSPTLGTLILTRVAAAAAAAAYTPNAGAVAAAIVPSNLRARALAVVIGGLTVATALGVPLGRIAATTMSWRASLVLVGVISLVAALGVFTIMPKLPGNPSVTLKQRLSVLARPGVMLVLPLTVLGMAACYTPYAFTIQVLETLQISAPAMTAMLLIYGLGAVAGNYLSGWGTDRYGPTAVLVAAYAAMILTLAGLALAGTAAMGGPLTVALLMAIWGASSWSQSPAQQHRLITAAPQEAPLVVALNSSGIYFGIALGTAIGSHALGSGVTAMLWYGSALAAVAFVYVLLTASHDSMWSRHLS